MWNPSPSSTLVSLCWTLSCTPVSLLHREAQNWTLRQVWSHQCWIKGQDHLPCNLGYPWPSLQQGHIPGSCSTSYAPGLPARFWPCCFPDDPQHIILYRIVLPQVQKILHFSLNFVGLPVTHFFSLYPLKQIFYYVKYFAPCNRNWTHVAGSFLWKKTKMHGFLPFTDKYIFISVTSSRIQLKLWEVNKSELPVQFSNYNKTFSVFRRWQAEALPTHLAKVMERTITFC